MKLKLAQTFTALAAISGLSLSFAVTPKEHPANKHHFANVVYAILRSNGCYSYTATKPALPLTCSTNANTSCTLSTTATAAYFTTHNGCTFPTQSATAGHPILVYLSPNKIYQ